CWATLTLAALSLSVLELAPGLPLSRPFPGQNRLVISRNTARKPAIPTPTRSPLWSMNCLKSKSLMAMSGILRLPRRPGGQHHCCTLIHASYRHPPWRAADVNRPIDVGHSPEEALREIAYLTGSGSSFFLLGLAG